MGRRRSKDEMQSESKPPMVPGQTVAMMVKNLESQHPKVEAKHKIRQKL